MRRLALALCLLLAGCKGATDAPTDSTSAPSSAIGKPKSIEIRSKSGIALVLLPGGTFTMGSDAGEEDEKPPHEVTVSAFAIDKFEVTQAEYGALELPDPSHYKDPQRPVEQIRWSDAALFCNLRSEAEGLEPCYDEATFACNFEASGYRLPTEAEGSTRPGPEVARTMLSAMRRRN